MLNFSEPRVPSVYNGGILPLYPSIAGNVMEDNAWKALEPGKRSYYQPTFYNLGHSTSVWLQPVVFKRFTH